MRSPVSSPRLSDEVSSLLSSTWHRNHIANILIPACAYLWNCMSPVLSPSYLWFLCLCMILRWQIALLHIVVLHTTRANGKLLFTLAFLVTLRGFWFKSIGLTIIMPALMLSPHSSSLATVLHPFKRHITLLTHTQHDASLKAASCAGRLPSR